jgi:hypothetical protein
MRDGFKVSPDSFGSFKASFSSEGVEDPRLNVMSYLSTSLKFKT